MNFTDYASLQSAIADELNRSDLTTAIPGFISLMESQTERQLRTREMLASVSFTIDAEFENLPAQFLEVRSFYLNTTPITPLLFRTIESMEQFKRANPGVGKPTDYTVLGNQFMFVKTPDSAYTATLVYYQNIPRLTNVNTTNWLLEKHPDIYFYGSLLNSAPYLKDDARIPVWIQLYQNAVEALKVADERAQTAANNLKSQARMF